jgi:superoxide dismutase, Cu-Zn family
MMRGLMICSVGALMLAGCMDTPAAETAATTSPTEMGASATLAAADGSSRGTATIRNENGVMRVTVDASGMPQGAHGLHVHTVGRCDAPSFESAGPHWNPTGKMHGRDNPMGPHQGDLPNLMAGTDGSGSVSFDLPGSMAALMDADGAAIIVHAAADDYKTDPSGNSGGRIACGVFTAR